MDRSRLLRVARLRHSISIGIFIGLLMALYGPSTHAQSVPIIESDNSQVTLSGKWSKQTVEQASGSSYLYSSGAEADILTLQFSGPSIEVMYVAGPSLGTLAIDIDGTVLRTVITTADQTAYQQSSRVDYLTNEPHELKVYAQEGGIVGVDAFIIPTEKPTSPPDPLSASSAGEVSGETRATTCTPVNTIHRVSLNHLGEQTNRESNRPSLSGNGRYVGFVSFAALVPADNNGLVDVYLYDRQTCTLQLVSVTAQGSAGNDESAEVYVSADGNYVAYNSFATDLVAGDTNNRMDIFVYDRQTGNTARVSESSNSDQGNEDSFNPVISVDGRYVVFESSATNLVVGDTNGFNDIFMRDRLTNTTTRVSIADDEAQAVGGESNTPAVSLDGRFIAFRSTATNLVAGDTNGFRDIFVRDMQANTTIRVSVNNTGEQGNADSFAPTISANGSFIAFHSNAINLVTDDTNGVADVFLHNTQNNTTSRISVSNTGAQGNGVSGLASISADGRYVTFISAATNLVTGDTNGVFDAFVRDTRTNITHRVSISSQGIQGNGPVIVSTPPVSISADGRYIVFSSIATNLVTGDTNGFGDVFVTPRVQSTADALALFNPPFNHVDLINTLTDNPPYTAYTAFSAYAPVSGGQWVMGDWDGDGLDTPGVYANGPFFFTNKSGESQPSDWGGFWIGINGPVVAGRFSNAPNDCIGAVDAVPSGGVTIFALYFTCDMSGVSATPPLSFQWLSTPLPDPTFVGTYQFSAGDFDGDGLDSIAVRRNEFIAFGNVTPSAGNAVYDLAQFIGAPGTGDGGTLVVGDWDGSGADSFGLFYQNGELFYRNDLDFNSGVYVNQSIGAPFGSAGVQVATWR